MFATMSKRDKAMLLCLLGVVIFLALYLGVHNYFKNRLAEVETEIAALEPRLAQLREYAANEKRYESEIAEARLTINGLVGYFPRDVRSEDLIMLAIGLESDVGLSISSANFVKNEPFLEFKTVVDKEPDGYYTLPVMAWRGGMSVSCALTYPQLKSAVQYIYSRTMLTTLDSVSVSYDSSTGELFGSMGISKFFVTGIDDAYQQTQVPPIGNGTPNIFGSVTTN